MHNKEIIKRSSHDQEIFSQLSNCDVNKSHWSFICHKLTPIFDIKTYQKKLLHSCLQFSNFQAQQVAQKLSSNNQNELDHMQSHNSKPFV